MGRQLELDELVEHFTLLPDEVALLRNKSGATRLGFAVLRRPELVREVLLERCRSQRIEPPARGRMDRMVASALHRAEDAFFIRVAGRLPAEATARIMAPIADTAAEADDVEQSDRSLLSLIKADPGNVSSESMLTEIDKLLAARAIALPPGLFADIAPKVIARWHGLAAVEAPSHLRAHPNPAKTVCLLAALLHARERELTDVLVELLIATVHRINARAERRVTAELINAFRRVTGKENIVLAIADAALGAPDDTVREVVFPAVAGASRRCGSWCTSTRPRARCISAR